ncbi:MAG: hypothetical protein ACLU62_08330 [Hydrogeniiclostridium sp.]
MQVCFYGCGEAADSCLWFAVFAAEIWGFGPLSPMKIEEIRLMDGLPAEWAYPEIQPPPFGEASALPAWIICLRFGRLSKTSA